METIAEDGKVSRQQAEQKAFAAYETFNKHQTIESDFDRVMKRLTDNKEINR